jgi:hypothetical protein
MLDRYPELRRVFLQHLARYGSVAAAAAHIRISTMTVKDFVERNPRFAGDFENAMDEHRGKIEKAIYERGVEGVDEPKFGAGGQIGVVRKYSDALLLAYARRHIAEYREGDVQRTVVSGAVQHEHSVDMKALSTEQRAALRLLLGEQKDAIVVEQPKQIEVSPREETDS